MARLDGKVALITGGARGQGRSHALTLAREGADIIICDLSDQLPTAPYPLASAEELEETARLVEDLDRRCIALEADVRDGDQMRGVVERGLAEFGGIDILLANAGIESFGKSWELTEEQWEEMISVNLTGAWQSAKAVIPHMIEREQGVILMTSSIAGMKGLLHESHYGAAKYGMVGLMRTLAIELAPYSIRVNTIHPSSVDTPIIKNQAMYTLFSGGDPDATLEEVEPTFRSLNLLDTPWMEPGDISNAILWLASDEARYVTGAALPVDAGLLVK